MWKYLFAIVVTIGVIAGGHYMYQHRHQFFRPDFDRTGGTLLVFEIEDELPAGGLDEVLDVIQKRFDPGGSAGIVARVDEEGRVEVCVPFGKQHDDLVERTKRLAVQPAAVAFRAVATRSDDEPVYKVVEMPVKAVKLDVPPPPPRNEHGGEEFPLSRPIASPSRYRWIRLSDGQVKLLYLDRLGLTRENPGDQSKVEESVRKGVPLSPTFMSQLVVQARLLKEAAEPSFFLLVREPAAKEDVRTGPLENVRVSGGRGRAGISFRLSKTTDSRLMELMQNVSIMPSGLMNWQVVLLLDGEALGAPYSLGASRRELQLNGDFTVSEAEDMVVLLRGGPLPCRLKFLREIGVGKKN
jgi:hypothetical protein